MTPYDHPIYNRLYSLSIEYWSEERVEKIGRLLGTLIDEVDIMNSDSYFECGNQNCYN